MLAIYLLIEETFDNPGFFELTHRSIIIMVGLSCEMLFRQIGLTDYPTTEYFLPLWLIIVWFSFGLTFHGCYRWLQNYSLWIAVVLGALFGPICYWLASRLAPYQIIQPLLFTLSSSIFWGTLFGLLISFSKKRSKTGLKPSGKNA